MRHFRRCDPDRGEPGERSAPAPRRADLHRLLGGDGGRAAAVLRGADGGLRHRAIADLQQAVGNSSVQRLMTGTALPVQRYAVGARRTASCEQVIAWLNTRNPHRPAWAKTTPRFTWTGTVEVSGTAPDFQVGVADPQVTVNTTVDMPEWNPSDPAMATAWQAMYGILRAHEAEHEAIGAQWRDTLRERLAALSLTVSARSRAAAQQAAQQAVQAEWRGWLAEHQNDQNAIDPFTAVLECPPPPSEQASP